MIIKEILARVKHLDIYTNRQVNSVFAGNYKSSFRGQGLEVEDIRSYEEGDDIRHIDWISTAKQGQAYVKKYKETRELTTMLMIDVSASMNFGSGVKSKKETLMEIVATLLISGFKNNDKLGAVLLSNKIIKYLPPKKGKSQLLIILREIITAFENNNYTTMNLKAGLDFLNQYLQKRSVCFLLSDNITEEVGNSLKIANQKHDLIFINIFDPWEKGIDFNSVLQIEDPETGINTVIDLQNETVKEKFKAIRMAKYEKMKQFLQKNRIDKVEISTNDNIYQQLLFFFKKRQKRL